MTNSFEHFHIQDLVDETIASILRWVGKDDVDLSRCAKIDTALKTTRPTELRIDNAWRIEDRDGPMIAGIEVQLSDVNGKQGAWDRYVALLSAQHNCPVILIILTPDEAIAKKSRTIAARIRRQWGAVHVIGPSTPSTDTLRMDTHERRCDALLRAAITQDATLIHAIAEDLMVGYAKDEIEQNLYTRYITVLERVTPDDIWAHLMETTMEFVGTFEKAWNGGVEQGRAQGVEQGRVQGLRSGIVVLADARGLSLSKNSRARLNACANIEQLRHWLTWVGTADANKTDLPSEQ